MDPGGEQLNVFRPMLQYKIAGQSKEETGACPDRRYLDKTTGFSSLKSADLPDYTCTSILGSQMRVMQNDANYTQVSSVESVLAKRCMCTIQGRPCDIPNMDSEPEKSKWDLSKETQNNCPIWVI